MLKKSFSIRRSRNAPIILLMVTGIYLIAHGYYQNGLGAVEATFYENWQQVFETPVVGRLAWSAQHGIFSEGALLGLGDFDVPAGENPSVQVWMAPSKVITHQYNAYLGGESFTTFTRYDSAPGTQGILFGAFDRISAFSPSTNLKIFRMSEAILTAIVLTALFTWFGLEFGLPAMLLGILFAAFSLWLTLLGGNLYWNLWAFYLPLTGLVFLLQQKSTHTNGTFLSANILLLATALIKILFNGFEFVTTAWVMYSVPLIYFAVLNRWGWRDFLKRELSFVGTLALATAIGLFVLSTQIASVEGGYGRAVYSILNALQWRSVGNPNDFSGVFQEALRANLGSALLEYLRFPTLTISGLSTQNTLINSIAHLEYWVWIFLFAIFSILLAVRLPKMDEVGRNKGLALVASTWYSALAPLSWLIIFKAHAYIHVRLAPVVWQMPFIFFGLALIGYVLTPTNPKHKPKSQPIHVT